MYSGKAMVFSEFGKRPQKKTCRGKVVFPHNWRSGFFEPERIWEIDLHQIMPVGVLQAARNPDPIFHIIDKLHFPLICSPF